VEDLIAYGVLGVILGGRIGYMLFYSADRWMADPTLLLRIWEGGMSFHGGLLGVTAVIFLYSRANKIKFLSLADFVAPLVPAGLFFGRLGNFVNQELYGRATDVSWAMIFPADPLRLPRHPSQLYEAFLEGILLFIIVHIFARRPRSSGQVAGIFLVFYGFFRFLVEFVRQPDAQFLNKQALLPMFDWMTRGQLLCIPMILLGLWFLRNLYSIKVKE
jgi:phosphatidylglycerol:prolipoprotein diacylglycerol transferase